MIKKTHFIIIFVLIHLSSYSSEKCDLYVDPGLNCINKPLLLDDSVNQGSYQTEKHKIVYNYDSEDIEHPSSFWSTFLSCLPSMPFFWEHIKEPEKKIYSLPTEVLLYLAEFLYSPDILMLSNTCSVLRQVYNQYYWLNYWSKLSRTHPYLTIQFPPIGSKVFFAHLWYCEGYNKLAAKLNHPEATILQDYGVYIQKDQYLCPSGTIRCIFTKKVDNEKTEKLWSAKKLKQNADMERQQTRQNLEKLIFNRGRYGYNF